MCDGRNEKVQNAEKSDLAIDDLDRELNDYNAQAAQEIKRAAEEPKNKKQGESGTLLMRMRMIIRSCRCS